MKNIVNLLALVFLLVSSSICKFQPTGKVQIPSNLLATQYSPDQKYVLFATENSIQMNNGVSMQFIRKFNFENTHTFASLAISQDSSVFAVGYKTADNSTHFGYYATDFNQNLETPILRTIKINADVTGEVSSLCYTADNARIVLGTINGDIIIWQSNQLAYTIKFGQSLPITSIVCSPYRSLQFTVAGGLDKTVKKLTTYYFNVATKQIKQYKNYPEIDQNQVIFDLQYSATGMQVHRVGTTNKIYTNSVDQNLPSQILLPDNLKNVHKIRLSKKGDIISLSNGKQIWIRKYIPDANGFQYVNYTTNNPQFGLAPKGSNVLYVNTQNTGSVLGQCPTGKFLNDATDTCDSCSASCSLCLDRPTTCYSCFDGHFLRQYQCLSCVSNCRICSDDTFCKFCYDPFILNSTNLCGCIKGKFVSGNTCATCSQGCLDCSDLNNCKQCDQNYNLDNGLCISQGGFPTVAIVFLVILGLAVVVIITAVIVKKLRKSQKRSQLLSDNDSLVSKEIIAD